MFASLLKIKEMMEEESRKEVAVIEEIEEVENNDL